MALAEVRKSRAAAVKEFTDLAGADMTAEQETRFKALEAEIAGFDAKITRMEKAQALAAASATPVADQDDPGRTTRATVPATVDVDPYRTEKGLIVGGIARMIGKGNGNSRLAADEAKALYGESHPVTRALNTGEAGAGGFLVQPEYAADIIELLRPLAIVRGSGPRNIPMPRGTMTFPGQASPATATYQGESLPTAPSQQKLNQIVASYKKLTALTPVSNDLMRYANPAADAFVRDDLVKVIALKEDLAFLTFTGVNYGPRGYVSFAGTFAQNGSFYVPGGGTPGVYAVGSPSVYGTGGNYVTSATTPTLDTVSAELTGAINNLDTANVPDMKRIWHFSPRTFNFLNGLRNPLGQYVYRDELSKGTLLGYAFKKSNQIPNNYQDPTGAYNNCTLVFLIEYTDVMLLDSMSLEIAVSREGTYIDASGNPVSAFTQDQTLIRAITEHDFQMRHDASVAIIQGVRWDMAALGAINAENQQ